MSDVFISHSSIDSEVANRVVNFLEEKGISCWIAPRDIVPGSDWAASINTAITASKVFLVIYSANSSQSNQVAREMSLAESKNGVFVIPYKIDETPLSGSFEYFLGNSHWINANYQKKDFKLEELYQIIISITGKNVQNITNNTYIDNLHIHSGTDVPEDIQGNIRKINDLQTKKCPSCGFSLVKGAKFCPGCGRDTTPKPAAAPKTEAEQKKLKCSFCGFELLPGTKFCPGCGRDTASQSAPSPEPAPVQNKLRCPSCGSELMPGVKFCPGCGYNTEPSSAPAAPVRTIPPVQPANNIPPRSAAPASPAQPLDKKKILLIAVPVCILLILVICIPLLSKSNDSSSTAAPGNTQNQTAGDSTAQNEETATKLNNACRDLYAGVTSGSINSSSASSYSFSAKLPGRGAATSQRSSAAKSLTVGDAMEYSGINADLSGFVYDSSGTIHYSGSYSGGKSLSADTSFAALLNK